MRKLLNFSNKFFKAEYFENFKSLTIQNHGILINLGLGAIKVDASGSIAAYKSYLLKDYKITVVLERAILVSFGFDSARDNDELNKFCMRNWEDNKKRFPDDPNKWQYNILRSPVEKIGKLEFNCWFLPKNSASSIHVEHPFKEVRTQIYGLGVMNKFKKQDYKTLYQRMYMPPGFTHEFFFDENNIYPWHQYEAISNSIWMAIVEYSER